VKDRRGLQRNIIGCGAVDNPRNRFEKIEIEPEATELDPGETRSETVFMRDASRSIVARNDSPDIGFEASINPYRGCSHGCIYCFARPTHEYLGFSAGLDFESKILVKKTLRNYCAKSFRPPGGSPRWSP